MTELPTERILVIGGSGFVGTEVVRQLLAAGHSVRIAGIVRDQNDPDLWVPCDVRDVDALRRACADVDVIYNLAAAHRDDVRPRSLYEEVNVGGARNLCDVATELSIKRIIFTSSVAVYGLPEGEVDETAECRPFNDYGRTKLAAEEVYREWAGADPGRSLTIVRPTVVFGEGNRGNVYELMRQIASGRFVMIGRGRNRKSMAYVENAAAFLIYALGFSPGYRLFNYVDKPDFDMNTLVGEISRAVGRKSALPFRVPYIVGYGLGLLLDGVAFLIKRNLPISAVRVKKFCASTQFSAAKAQASGFTPPVPLEAALRHTLAAEFEAETRRLQLASHQGDEKQPQTGS